MRSQRLHKDERHEQLLSVANQIIREEGTEALTLITLADKAGVTKPITYRHFGNRKTLLHILFQQTYTQVAETMQQQILKDATCLKDAVRIFAGTCINCMDNHGKEFSAIISALKAYPEYEQIDLEVQDFYCNTLQSSLAPFLPEGYQIPKLTLIMIYGATNAAGGMLLNGLITKDEMVHNVTRLICTQLAHGCNHAINPKE